MVIIFTEEDTESQPEEETNKVESKNIPTKRLLLSLRLGYLYQHQCMIIHSVASAGGLPSFSDQSFYWNFLYDWTGMVDWSTAHVELKNMRVF